MNLPDEDPVARLQALVDDLERQVAESEREMAAEQEERGTAARDGRLGPDWRAVQLRIDRGETSLAAVFGGTDPTPEAQRLRGQAQENLSRLAEADLPPELVEELRAQAAQWERVRRGPAAPPPVGEQR